MKKLRKPRPKYIRDESGKKTGVILSLKSYNGLIEDLQDLADIAARKEEPTMSHEDVKKSLEI